MDLKPSKNNNNNDNGENSNSILEPPNPNNGETLNSHEPHIFFEDIDSSCSTPYVSAPSSPGRGPIGFYYSAPASPMHFTAFSSSMSTISSSSLDASVSGPFEFEFSARFASTGLATVGSMSSADELFLNGQIRPMKLSTHLQRPQMLAPLLDLDVEDDDDANKDSKEIEPLRGRDLRLRDKSLRRRTKSLSPLRNASLQWHHHEDEEDDEVEKGNENEHNATKTSKIGLDLEEETNKIEMLSAETTPSVSASTSRSSSAGRNSKRWVFLKDFLYRSKSEGRSNGKFWSSISFSPAKEKKSTSKSSMPFDSTKEKATKETDSSCETMEIPKVKRSVQVQSKKSGGGKACNGVGKRRIPPSPHELHYTANRAQAEEMRKKTFLPYRQGLLGCLGFSSKGYGAMNGFARALNPVSSREAVSD